MKYLNHVIFQTVLWMSFCLTLSLCAADGDQIKVRIHVPYLDRLENESWTKLVARIENRSQSFLPILWSGNPDKEFTYIGGPKEHSQFLLQTKSDSSEPAAVASFNWENITGWADSGVASGQAIEFITCRGLHLPKQSGEYRFAFKTGPDKVIYSNWVKLTQYPAQDHTAWPVLATVQTTLGESGFDHFLIGETPSGKWLFRSPANPIPEYDKRGYFRIYPLSDVDVLEVSGDYKRSQAIIRLSGSGKPIYYNARLGVSRSTPWPEGNTGGDFNNKPIPVDDPSPLEFPLGLFEDGRANKLRPLPP